MGLRCSKVQSRCGTATTMLIFITAVSRPECKTRYGCLGRKQTACTSAWFVAVSLRADDCVQLRRNVYAFNDLSLVIMMKNDADCGLPSVGKERRGTMARFSLLRGSRIGV